MDVKKKFNPTLQFFRFVCTSYVTALGKKILTDNYSIVSTTPLDSVTDNEKEEILEAVANLIVEFEWQDIGYSIRQTKLLAKPFCLLWLFYNILFISFMLFLLFAGTAFVTPNIMIAMSVSGLVAIIDLVIKRCGIILNA